MSIVWTVRLFFLGALLALIVGLASANIPKSQTKVYVGVPLFTLVVLWMGAEHLLERRRISQLRARLTLLGFAPREDDDIHYEPSERDRNLTLGVNMNADWKGIPIRFTEFSFLQGSGKNTTRHRFAQAAAEAPDIPEFRLKPAGFLASRGLGDASGASARKNPLHARFARRWRLEGPHDAEALLPEPLLEWLLSAPRCETWTSVGGEVSCSWKRGCTPLHAEQMLARLATFLRLYRA